MKRKKAMAEQWMNRSSDAFKSKSKERPGSRPGKEAYPPRLDRAKASFEEEPEEQQLIARDSTEPRRLLFSTAENRTRRERTVWVYDSMVTKLPDGDPRPGETVELFDQDTSRFIGSAVYNPTSTIRARLFSLGRQQFNADYVRKAVFASVIRRNALRAANAPCRLIFSDADLLPGVIADFMGNVIVVQILTMAAEQNVDAIRDTLQECLNPQGIVIRRDSPVRTREGLHLHKPDVHGTVPQPLVVDFGTYKLIADPIHGQKTGLFLDQRDNRKVIQPYVSGKRVLDLFTHAGGWAFEAAAAGAAEVLAVDSSPHAIEQGQRGAELNGFTQVQFRQDDVFEFLEKRIKKDAVPDIYDVIICDPPAFAKGKAQATDAVKAYLSLNYRAMKLLPIGGLLVSCSCSQSVGTLEFEGMLVTAARNAGLQFQLLERRGAPPDHPVLLGMPETDYLKCFVLQRIE